MDESDSVEDLQHLARTNWNERAKKIGNYSGKREKELMGNRIC